MRKFITILVLLLFASPMYVSACSPAISPFGLHVKIKDCDFTSDNNRNEIVFDLLIKKEEVDARFLTGTININYYEAHEGYDFANPDDSQLVQYLEYDQDWISYSAYISNIDTYTETYDCGSVFGVEFYDEFLTELITEFKIVVLDANGSTISESGIISTSVIPSQDQPENESYNLIYDTVNKSFAYEHLDIDWDNYPGDCGMVSYIFILAVFALMALLGLSLVFVEPIVIKKRIENRKLPHHFIMINVMSAGLIYYTALLDNIFIKMFVLMYLIGITMFKFWLIIKYSRKLSYYILGFNILIIILYTLFVFRNTSIAF